MASDKSKVLTVEAAKLAYDAALLDWEKTFGWPVFGQSAADARRGTALEYGDGDFTGYWVRRGLELYLWPLLLGSLAVGGDGPTVRVTRATNPLLWTGPFQGNLRSFLHARLALASLSQSKARASGVWKPNPGQDAGKNAMRIRLPHR